MFWDIVLAVVAFGSQAVTGYLGWRVTVDGPKPERRKLYEILFIGGIIVSGLAIGASAFRARGTSDDLAELKAGQRTANAGIEQIERTPPTVNVSPQINIPSPAPPKEHSAVTFVQPFLPTGPGTEPLLPFHQGQKPALNIGFKNAGEFTVRPTEIHSMVLVVPIGDSEFVFPKPSVRIGQGPP